MKNKIIITLICLVSSMQLVYAGETPTVISDETTIKKLQESFNEVNQYTDSFFTPHLLKSKEKPITNIKKGDGLDNIQGSPPPIKKLRLILRDQRNAKNKKPSTEVTTIQEKDQAILDCDVMEYFAERTELEANGNVVMTFPENNSTIKADKVVYNQTSNIIQAFGHVVLINDGKEMFGDYMNIDMNEENAVMDNPVTDSLQVHAKARKGYMYGDKLVQEQGSLLVTKKTMINVVSEMFGPNLDTMFVNPRDKSYIKKDSHGEKFKIKTNEIIINSKKEHDTLTLKHAEIYLGEKKVGLIPTITMHTNKNRDYAEANFPEIGTLTNMGLYAGPGFVFDTPGGSTVKVVPMLNYQSTGNSGSDSSSGNPFGYGSIVKFKSATNKTDFGYGTANKILLTRGYQRLDDNLILQYSTNSFMDDWFMGYRMPKLMGEIVYQDDTQFANFLGDKKSLIFTHRIAAGYAQDGDYTTGFFDNNGSIGTMRFKYMAELAQTLWAFNDMQSSPINARFDIVGQGATALYGTGNTQMIARLGPRLHTQYKSWMQDVGYFLSAYDDNTPFTFDRYAYGRSNAYLRESFRVCKYLTLSWFGSLNLSGDSPDGNMIQENGFYFSLGPDDVKLNIGYDTVRQQSFVTMAMHLDAKGSIVEYKKMTIKNPDTLGKTKDGKNQNPNQSFVGAMGTTSGSGTEETVDIEKAEVINIPQEAL